MLTITYTSNNGCTKRYAESLAKICHLPCLSILEAQKKLQLSEDVVHMGWVCAETIRGADNACRKFNVKAVCGVGMSTNKIDKSDMFEKYKRRGIKCFYLRGDFDPIEVKNMSEMFNNMYVNGCKAIEKFMSGERNLSEEEADYIKIYQITEKNKDEIGSEMLDLLKNGCHFYDEAQLKELKEWICQLSCQ